MTRLSILFLVVASIYLAGFTTEAKRNRRPKDGKKDAQPAPPNAPRPGTIMFPPGLGGPGMAEFLHPNPKRRGGGRRGKGRGPPGHGHHHHGGKDRSDGSGEHPQDRAGRNEDKDEVRQCAPAPPPTPQGLPPAHPPRRGRPPPPPKQSGDYNIKSDNRLRARLQRGHSYRMPPPPPASAPHQIYPDQPERAAIVGTADDTEQIKTHFGSYLGQLKQLNARHQPNLPQNKPNQGLRRVQGFAAPPPQHRDPAKELNEAEANRMASDAQAVLINMWDDRLLIPDAEIMLGRGATSARVVRAKRQAGQSENEAECGMETRVAACEIANQYNIGTIFLLPFDVSDEEYGLEASAYKNIVDLCAGKKSLRSDGDLVCPPATSLKKMLNTTTSARASYPVYVGSITGGAHAKEGLAAKHYDGDAFDIWCDVMEDICFRATTVCVENGAKEWSYPAQNAQCANYVGNARGWDLKFVHCTF